MNKHYGFAVAFSLALASAVLAGCLSSYGSDTGSTLASDLNASLQVALANSTTLSDQLVQSQFQFSQSQQQYQQATSQLTTAQKQLADFNASRTAMLQAILASLQTNSTATGVTTGDIETNFTAVTDYACQLYFTSGYYTTSTVAVPPQCLIPIGNLFVALQKYFAQNHAVVASQTTTLVQSYLSNSTA